MQNRLVRLFVTLMIVVAVCRFAVAAEAKKASSKAAVGFDTASSDPFQNWETDGWPMLSNFCVDCHNDDYQEAEVDLSLLQTVDGIRQNPELATHAVSMIRFGAMPPEDASLPTSDERRDLADHLDNVVFRCTCDLRPKPGRVTARRLNRAEYNHAIRDLFDIGLRPADSFPSDEVGGGFDNNADVLSLSMMLMEKYLSAGEKVAQAVIVDPATLPSIDLTFADQKLPVIGDSQLASFGEWYVRKDGIVWIDLQVDVAGTYQLAVLGGSNVKPPKEIPDAHRCVAVHDDQGRLIEVLDFSYESRSGRNDHESFKRFLEPGKHRFFFSVTDAWESPKTEPGDRKEPFVIGESVSSRIKQLSEKQIADSIHPPNKKIETVRGIDSEEFDFKFRYIVATGPSVYDRKDLPPTQKQLVRRVARWSDDRWSNVESSASDCLKPLMRRAFRRDVSKEEVNAYADLVATCVENGDSYYAGLQHAVTAILCSPHFLFRVDLPETDGAKKAAAKGEPTELSPYQLASRISFFLWSSIPDEELLRRASKNELSHPKRRLQCVKRMLADPKSDSLGHQFATQWFGLGNLNGRDLAAFRSRDSAMTDRETASMLSAETERLFLHVLHNNLPVSEMLTADYTFVDSKLASWYGIDGVRKDRIDRVSLANANRRGLLGHAGILTLTSYPTRNSPVLRGKWILENVLGTPPPEAPPNVPDLESTKMASDDATLREQLEVHRADPGCASCHRVMDALGFGLETLDHLGRLRPSDDPAVADANGELPGGRSFQGALELSEVLADTESRRFAETTIRRLMAFAIGRELRPADRCFVEAILESTQKDGYRLQDLILGVIESPPFLTHQLEP